MKAHPPTLCTLTDGNYVLQCLALLESIDLYIEPSRVEVLALDVIAARHLLVWSHAHPQVRVTLLANVLDELLAEAKRTRTPQEFAWTCASWWLEQCLRHGHTCIYLDADSAFFGDPTSAIQEIGDASIALTPHRFDPEHLFREAANGFYNANFVYVRATQDGHAFVREWRDLVLDWCKNESDESGRFGDQGYLTHLANLYPVFDIQDLGINLAPWNAGQYTYRQDGTQVYVSNGQREDPVVLYHFHELALSEGVVTRRTNWQLNDALIASLYTSYEQSLQSIHARMF